jgi:hypothetical protein
MDNPATGTRLVLVLAALAAGAEVLDLAVLDRDAKQPFAS